jgi:hypothetical protein
VDTERKHAKKPEPVDWPLEFTEPLPLSNSQSAPPDCRSTTTRLKVFPPVVGGCGGNEATFSVTGSDTGLFETAEEVNVTVT